MLKPTTVESFDYYRAEDPPSGCQVVMQKCADGRFAIQFDDLGEVLYATPEELLTLFPVVRDMRWVAFELLREHVNAAHIDESYVELAAR